MKRQLIVIMERTPATRKAGRHICGREKVDSIVHTMAFRAATRCNRKTVIKVYKEHDIIWQYWRDDRWIDGGSSCCRINKVAKNGRQYKMMCSTEVGDKVTQMRE